MAVAPHLLGLFLYYTGYVLILDYRITVPVYIRLWLIEALVHFVDTGLDTGEICFFLCSCCYEVRIHFVSVLVTQLIIELFRKRAIVEALYN